MAHGGKRPNAGRPKGKPNAVTADVREAAQQYGADALRTLADIMRSEEYPPAARVAASKEILDRAYGKSQQAIDHTSSDGTMGRVEKVEISIVGTDATDQGDEATS